MDEPGQQIDGEAVTLVWRRVSEFRQLGYDDGDALILALSDEEPGEVGSRISDLLKRGCPPRTAREISR